MWCLQEAGRSAKTLICMQGMVQGALGGTKAMAQGLGPLLYAGIFSLFSTAGHGLPYFPGKTPALCQLRHPYLAGSAQQAAAAVSPSLQSQS